MPNSIAREAELRRNVIDRLIDASLNDAMPAREANLQRWRTLKTARNDMQGPAEASAV
jgi:hypothetical protein